MLKFINRFDYHMDHYSKRIRKYPLRKAATDSKRGRRKRYFMENEEDEIGERKRNISPPVQSDDKSTDIQTKSDHEPCSSGFCSHYITLIEEKARNHKLNRKVEELEERILCLEELLMTQNVPVTYIKEELVEEDEVENKINDSI